MTPLELDLREIELLKLDLKFSAEASLAAFTKLAWKILEPTTPLVWNWHLDVICAYLEAYFRRDIKRLIINIPPGMMKSLLVSVLGPAWVWIGRPERRFINLTNEIGLATRDSLRMRQVIESDWYQENWGDRVELSSDQREKMHFVNTSMGFRQGLGIGGNITGKRGTDLLIDDPIDAKKAFSDVEIQNVNDIYDQSVSSRLNDPVNDGICLIMQRLRTNDLTGYLLGKDGQDWVHLCIPMEYDGPRYDAGKDIGRPDLNDPRTEYGELMFPARVPEKTVAGWKVDLGEYGTSGQLQQNPVPLGGGILKKHWWRRWPKDRPPPEMEHIFYSWDTAFTEKDFKNNAFSAFLKWGIFWDESESRYALMMLKRWHGHVGYPDLRGMALGEDKESKPHCHFVEKKASGISLIQDLRRAHIRVRTVTPTEDKVARAHIESPLLREGLVYAPERKWADEVINFISSFPNGQPPSADYTDVLTQTLRYLRLGWWLKHPDDEIPPPPPKIPFADDDDWYGEGKSKQRPLAYGS